MVLSEEGMAVMVANEHPIRPMRVGFISTRISGSDGVSLEIAKWANVLEHMGHTCHYIAGQCDRPDDRSIVIPEARFTHPVIKTITDQCFGRVIRTPDVTQMIHEMIWIIKQRLRTAIERLQVDLIIAENCVTIPLNIPLTDAHSKTERRGCSGPMERSARKARCLVACSKDHRGEPRCQSRRYSGPVD
jgi:hypothetical protein